MQHTSHATTAQAIKIRQKTTGLIFERWGPDAAACIDGGGFEPVTDGSPSIREVLEAKSRDELNALAGGGRYVKDERAYVISTLIRLVELGEVTL
jgi:hypothetical protein